MSYLSILEFPKYDWGRTISLYVRKVESKVEFSISEFLIDHQGNEENTAVDCIVE